MVICFGFAWKIKFEFGSLYG